MITVRVPATTANLGPGFDCLALALNLYNEADFDVFPSGEGADGSVKIDVTGEGVGVLSTGGDNLIVRAARRLYQEAGQPFPARLAVHCRNRVPLGSGLGSSAAAIVTGLAGANALLGSPFSAGRILELASELEGHPDNAAAAVLGGLVLVTGGKALLARRVEMAPLDLAVVVPEFNLPTHAARAALPGQVPLADAVFNAGHAVLVVEALRSGDLELLGQVMEDRLHQPYRLKLVPGAAQALAAARQAGAAAATLSGAGPGVIAFGRGDLSAVAAAMLAAFTTAGLPARSWLVSPSPSGVHIVGS